MDINDLDQFLESPEHPLGSLRRQGRALQQTSLASHQGAMNLLTKARRAISAGDTARATTLFTRATSLPYDDFEKSPPAGIAASMMLFNLISDEAESADPSDQVWLDAATDVLAGTTGTGRADLQRILVVIGADYNLEPRENKAVRRAVADMPELVEMRDIAKEDHAGLSERVYAVLLVCNAYESALAARRLAALGGSDAAASAAPRHRDC